MASVQITNYTGEEENGNVILKGVCAKCGHEVVRGVETSEADHSGNQGKKLKFEALSKLCSRRR